MKNLLVLLLLLAGHVAANEYKDFLRADKEERREMVRKNGKQMSDYVLNIKYAFPERCNTLEEANAFSMEMARISESAKRDRVFFIPCGYENPYSAKEAISVYEAVMVHDNDTAYVLYVYKSTSGMPFYASTTKTHKEPLLKMVEQGRQYSVKLFHDFTPNVKVY
jgi:hypothetical protein